MIPVNEPRLDGSELDYVRECLESGWISSAGSYIDAFEERWADTCGRRHGVAVANGTVALQLAIAALDLPEGSEVIMPSFTIISCALGVIYNGCIPVLVDCDPATWCMDVSSVEERITERTRAIMPVHIYGHPVNMDPILEIAEKHDLVVIEDAAEAHGAEYRSERLASWVPCGGFGEISTFSFYANKLVTTGEGGMLLTDDPEIAAKARTLRNLAFGAEERFRHEELGFNFRMTNLQAALGVAQVERFAGIVERKRWIAETYREHLQNLDRLQLPIEMPWAKNAYWMFAVVLDEDTLNAREIGGRLRELGIETRPFFRGMHEQPVLRDRGLFEGETYPVTESISQRGLYLPSGLALESGQIQQVADALKTVLG